MTLVTGRSSTTSLPGISHQQLTLPIRTRPTVESGLTRPITELKDGHLNPPSGPSLEFPDPASILEKILQFIRTIYETAVVIFPSALQGIGAVWNFIVSTAQELYPGIRDQILAWYTISVQFVEDHPGVFVVIPSIILAALFWL